MASRSQTVRTVATPRRNTQNQNRTPRLPSLAFSEKLVLNQWLISLFGIDPLATHTHQGKAVRPFHALTQTLRDCREGLAEDKLHHYYHQLKLGWLPNAAIHPAQLLRYEKNIVEHTQWLNEHRSSPIEWKYYQWLSLLFAEVYLDWYFNAPDILLQSLNQYVDRFNLHWSAKSLPQATGISHYTAQELNKLCLQNATGSGKTLLMHINFRQFAYWAQQAGQNDSITRSLLITPNESLSLQHAQEMRTSGIDVGRLVLDNNDLYSSQSGQLNRVDFIEITKLGEKDGPTSIATRNLGDRNLILVDEGHRGMGKAEEDGWYRQREKLTDNGFAFEYSATFREAVNAAANPLIEQAYAKAVLFDYSYRYFYEDGYGKDYRIFNIPPSQADTEFLYVCGALLTFYQQLRLYADKRGAYAGFQIEKPLWVFVGGSVSNAKKRSADEEATVTDVARVMGFFARFLAEPQKARQALQTLLFQSGAATGLLTSNGLDIFNSAFLYLRELLQAGMDLDALYTDVLARVFNNPAGGGLQVQRIKGDAGELVLQAGEASQHFGLINVGDAAGLAKHLTEQVAAGNLPHITVGDSDFLAAQFDSVKSSASPINLLVGAKRFVEGWDCWRVSTLGLMRVGQSEGAQIIQLFGRGVRLKGWDWSLKRSAYAKPLGAPAHIRYLETLNVFGVQADYMAEFKNALEKEGVPPNDSKLTFTIPMNITHDFGQKLKVIRPRTKDGAGREYQFNRDGAMPRLGDVPAPLQNNPVVLDWYPRIHAMVAADIRTNASTVMAVNEAHFSAQHLAFLNTDTLYFELEKFKARENFYSLMIQAQAIKPLLLDTSWYRLLVPAQTMQLSAYANVSAWQQIALELLKKYCAKLFTHKRDAFILPRLRAVVLERGDEVLPLDGDSYTMNVDASETQLIADIQHLQTEVINARKAKRKSALIPSSQLKAILLGNHLYQPMLHASKGASVSVSPVALNESETEFVSALLQWLEQNEALLAERNAAIYLLRNKSRGSGVGFFEAGNFYPDFILWAVMGKQQNVLFAEPHGLMHEGPQHAKVQFHQTIKDIEKRLNDQNLRLESAILTPTPYVQLIDRGLSRTEWATRHVYFMDDKDASGNKVFIGQVMELLMG